MERVLSVAKRDNLISKDAVPPEIWRCSVFVCIYTQIAARNENYYSVIKKWSRPCLAGFIPFCLFWVWFGFLSSELSARIIVDLSFASVWMLLSPVLMAITEYRLSGLLDNFQKNSHHGWKLNEFIYKLPKRDMLYWGTTISFSLLFGIVFILGRTYIADIIGISKIDVPMLLLGSLCMMLTGFATGNGIWGLRKACLLYYFILRHSRIRWYPFRVKQISGLERLAKDGFLTATVFSIGATFAPISLRIFIESDSNIRYFALLGVAILVLGSAVLFSFITFVLYRLAKFSRQDVLEEIADKIEIHLSRNCMNNLSEKQDNLPTNEPQMELIDLLALHNSIHSSETHAIIISQGRNLILILLIPAILAFTPQIIWSIF